MINKSWIKNLKKDCILINTSRGEVIDENQIIKYLDNLTRNSILQLM